MKDPDNKSDNKYKKGGDTVTEKTVTNGNVSGEPTGNTSYVVIINDNNKLSYKVKLVNNKRGVQTADKKAVAEDDLERDNVRDN